MKRIFCVSLLSLVCAAPMLRAQDAAAVASRQEAKENYNILKGHVDELTESRDALLKRIQSLEKEIAELRVQVAKPTGNYASQEDLKHLADVVKEIDKKREDDKKLILKKIEELGGIIARPASHPKEKDKPHVEETAPPVNPDQPTITYTVKEGDYLSTIVQAYREKGINVTVHQILKLNPGLKANALRPKTKILIPDTRVAGTTPEAK